MSMLLKVKKGVGQYMDEGDNPTFENWLIRCQRLLDTRGESIADLNDIRWRDLYDQRVRPIRACNKALKASGAMEW